MNLLCPCEPDKRVWMRREAWPRYHPGAWCEEDYGVPLIPKSTRGRCRHLECRCGKKRRAGP
eukprot:11166935-Lingulodinium_polyedra.AAC.1